MFGHAIRRRHWAVVILLIVAACPPRTRTVFPAQPVYNRPDCPSHAIELTVYDSLEHGWTPRVVNDIPIASAIDEIPEFHDCQRLVRTHDREYGPLVGIFASEELETLYGTFDAKGEPVAPARAAELVRTLPAAAAIFSFDDEPYLPLSIRREFNCLYLLPPSSMSQRWTAYMVWARSDEKRCSQPLGDPANAFALDVHVHSTADYGNEAFAATDIPPVARWDVDRRTEQSIGIRCGGAWCSVGSSGIMPRPSEGAEVTPLIRAAFPAGGGPSENELRRVTRVPGWYDDQSLAIASPSGTAGLSPRGPRAVYYPDPRIGDMNDPAEFETWTPVAYAMIRGAPGAYGEKLHLGSGITKFELIFRRSGEDPPADVGDVSCGVSDGGTWWMRLTRGGGGPTVGYKCVTARAHPSAPTLPGTARWRWKVDDETTWVRCPQGCCSVN